MEGNSNWKPNQQGGDSLASNNANDWRSQLAPDMRKKVILAIVEKLKIYYPTRHPNAIKNTAFSFEGKIYAAAKDKDDYMRTIKGNIMNFDRKLQSSNVQSGSSVNGTNPPAPAAQALNQGQSVPTSLPYTQTPTSQQWLHQNNNNIQSNLNILESSGLPTQVSSAAQNLNIQMGEGVHSNLLPGSQRQIHGREHHLPQQPQSSNYFQNQMDQQLLKEEVQPPYMQQQQQSLLKQPIQQQLPHQTSLSNIQQSFPQPSALSSLPPSGQQNSQFLSRQNQFPTQRVHSSHHQQQMHVPSQEQKRQEREQFISHLMNDKDTQQNHLTPQQNNGEKQAAFRASSSQQNNIASFQERPLQNNSIQQRLYSHSNNASALPSQQKQYNVHGSSCLAAQGQEVGQSQTMIQQQYQPQHTMQQPQNRILQQPLDDTQRFQASGSLLQTQQNQPYQLQRTSPANTFTSQDSTGQTVNASGGGDWQEETYQKIKALKEKYILVVSALYQKLSNKLREIDAHPQQKIQHGHMEKLRASKATLKLVLVFLNVSRNAITESHREKFNIYEEQLLRFVKHNQTVTRRPMQQQQQQQQQVHLPPSQTHQTAVQSQSGHQVFHVPQSSALSNLTTSHTAMPHSSQTRPKMEPKEETNIMTLPASNPQPSMFQQKQFHHLSMQQRQQQQPQKNHQQLQMPKNEMNDVRMSQRVNNKAGLRQQNISPNQRHLAKPLASPQLVDQQILPPTFNKNGTSSQSGGSPSVAPSSNLGDPENPISVESPSSHDYQLQPAAQEHPPEPNAERPIDRLIKAFQSSSPESLAQSINEMSSVISLTDRLAGCVQSIGGSRARVPQDLSERTRLRLQRGETNPTNKRFKRSITTQPIDITSETERYKQFSSLESEVDSTASSGSKANKIEAGLALLQEIVEVNRRLVETMVSICSEDVGPSEVTTGTIVMCSYAPVALCDTFQALYKSGHVSQIQPLRLLVPENYPHSPILIENIPFDSSVNKHEDLSARTRSRFGLSMKEFSEPMSLTEIAQAWDACARATMAEYAERHGGGTFSSKHGHWEPVLRAS
ncbi:probable mediator of RNA polymerase II transcription subunit 15c isoform X1 [Brassica napus]|nr:probable mediator of RNA polymerase II transcription subunit 15c isoform X1 [Brassica napus]